MVKYYELVTGTLLKIVCKLIHKQLIDDVLVLFVQYAFHLMLQSYSFAAVVVDTLYCVSYVLQ